MKKWELRLPGVCTFVSVFLFSLPFSTFSYSFLFIFFPLHLLSSLSSLCSLNSLSLLFEWLMMTFVQMSKKARSVKGTATAIVSKPNQRVVGVKPKTNARKKAAPTRGSKSTPRAVGTSTRNKAAQISTGTLIMYWCKKDSRAVCLGWLVVS